MFLYSLALLLLLHVYCRCSTACVWLASSTGLCWGSPSSALAAALVTTAAHPSFPCSARWCPPSSQSFPFGHNCFVPGLLLSCSGRPLLGSTSLLFGPPAVVRLLLGVLSSTCCCCSLTGGCALLLCSSGLLPLLLALLLSCHSSVAAHVWTEPGAGISSFLHLRSCLATCCGCCCLGFSFPFMCCCLVCFDVVPLLG